MSTLKRLHLLLYDSDRYLLKHNRTQLPRLKVCTHSEIQPETGHQIK